MGHAKRVKELPLAGGVIRCRRGDWPTAEYREMSLAPFFIAAGNPATFARNRSAGEDIQFPLALKWWDWPIEKINANVRVLCSGDIAVLHSIY